MTPDRAPKIRIPICAQGKGNKLVWQRRTSYKPSHRRLKVDCFLLFSPSPPLRRRLYSRLRLIFVERNQHHHVCPSKWSHASAYNYDIGHPPVRWWCWAWIGKSLLFVTYFPWPLQRLRLFISEGLKECLSNSNLYFCPQSLPFDINNKAKLTAYFILFFGSGLAAPFLLVRHQLLKK